MTHANAPAAVLWAQRSSATDPERNHVFLTISAPDVPKEKMTLDVQPTKVSFTGHSELKNVDYKVELELFAEIVPNESKINHTGKNIEMVLRKKELKEEFWPRLLKESKRLHFLKTDFDKVCGISLPIQALCPLTCAPSVGRRGRAGRGC